MPKKSPKKTVAKKKAPVAKAAGKKKASAEKVAPKAPAKKKAFVRKAVAENVTKSTSAPAKKKAVPAKPVAKKVAAKVQSAPKKTVAVKAKPAAKKVAVKSKSLAKPVVEAAPAKKSRKVTLKTKSIASKAKPASQATPEPVLIKKRKITPFIKDQRQRLLDLHDALVDAMEGIRDGNLRNGGDGSSSAFGQHQADAGSDAYDRDFALSLLSQEQDTLYEIQEAISRIDNGIYGICESCGKEIPEERLEVTPFARLTVDCQEKLERDNHLNGRSGRGGSVFGSAGSEETFESTLED